MKKKKVKLPRMKVPPPGHSHGDKKKEASKKACRVQTHGQEPECELCGSQEKVDQVGAFLDDEDWIWMCSKCFED